MSKTAKAQKIILRTIGRTRSPVRLNKLVRKYRGKLPMTFAIWNLVSAGELRRTRQRGMYVRS